jgi:hypothetical protein
MLFTKQLIFNSLITAKSLSVKYSKTIIILTSLSRDRDERIREKATKNPSKQQGKQKSRKEKS